MSDMVYLGAKIPHGYVFGVVDEETGCYELKFYPTDYIEENGDESVWPVLERVVLGKVEQERRRALELDIELPAEEALIAA